MNYHRWNGSGPFDIDDRSVVTFGKLSSSQTGAPYVAKNMAKECDAIKLSMSNASLARISPLAVWAAGVDNLNLHYRLIKADVTFTHTHGLVIDCAFLYSQAIAILLKNAGNSNKARMAFDHCMALTDTHAKTVYDPYAQRPTSRPEGFVPHSTKNWMLLAQENYEEFQSGKSDAEVIRSLNILVDDGSLRPAFVIAFYFLLRLQDGVKYEEALLECIRPGGDTDTKAAIVGGIMGAAVGVEAIPKLYTNRLL